MQHVFLVGAKSLGAYGGYETFVNKLTEYHQTNNNIKYHVACKKNGQGASIPENVEVKPDGTYTYHNADCFQIKIPEFLGPAQAIYYDLVALNKCISIIKTQKIESPIIYIMTCRIGPFFKKYVNAIHDLGGKIYLNPDGHEWLRAKWGYFTRKYWKFSEELMIKNSDLVICDSKNIEKYIHDEYGNILTTFIPYGAELKKSIIVDDDPVFINWLEKNGLKINEYYLVVGRFVPENNYETIIREFMVSDTKKKLVIITNQNKKFYNKLLEKYKFEYDKRIVFAGTVYNAELLKKIRENAFAYIHGHSVGGTNPSLLEALASTNINLLYDCDFNSEVAVDGALYWTKEINNFSSLISKCEDFDKDNIGNKAKERILSVYNWDNIANMYEKIWCRG